MDGRDGSGGGGGERGKGVGGNNGCGVTFTQTQKLGKQNFNDASLAPDYMERLANHINLYCLMVEAAGVYWSEEVLEH